MSVGAFACPGGAAFRAFEDQFWRTLVLGLFGEPANYLGERSVSSRHPPVFDD